MLGGFSQCGIFRGRTCLVINGPLLGSKGIHHASGPALVKALDGRATTYIKLENYPAALEDGEMAITMENGKVTVSAAPISSIFTRN